MKKIFLPSIIALCVAISFGCSSATKAAHDTDSAPAKAEEHAAVAAHKAGHGSHWGYTGDVGPAHWGDLSPEYETCKTGKAQSPIDVETSAVTTADLPAIEISYNDTPLVVTNNGHAIQVDYSEGSSIKIGDKKYDLLQFHFHSPSENTVDGSAFAGEMHLVHKAADGELAVIGVLFEQGEANDVLAKIWGNTPQKTGEKKAVEGAKINASSLLPSNPQYYHWVGSLTTPPCSEGVQWYLVKQPLQIGPQQVKTFLGIIGADARPVQPLNGRQVQVQK